MPITQSIASVVEELLYRYEQTVQVLSKFPTKEQFKDCLKNLEDNIEWLDADDPYAHENGAPPKLSAKTTRAALALLDPLSEAASHLQELQKSLARELLDVFSAAQKNNTLDELSPFEWARAMKGVDSEKGIQHLMRLFTPLDHPQWKAALLKEIPLDMLWNSHLAAWRDTPELARPWRVALLDNVKNKPDRLQHVVNTHLSKLWTTHALRFATHPEEDFLNATHAQVCEELIGFGVVPEWNKMPLAQLWIMPKDVTKDPHEMTTMLRERLKRLWFLHPDTAAPVFGALSTLQPEDEWKRAFRTSPATYTQELRAERLALDALQQKGTVCFQALEIMAEKTDETMKTAWKYLSMPATEAPDHLWVLAVRSAASDLQAHVLGARAAVDPTEPPPKTKKM